MKTIVFQSYRTEDVPGWIYRCLDTVRSWAVGRGFDYEFVDDRLFDYVPEWFRSKVDENKFIMSDLARLELAREFLAGKYQRAIWVDADILVFDPEQFEIEVTEEYAFCREVWIERRPGKKHAAKIKVNNAVSLFLADNSMLDFYIYACKTIVANHCQNFDNILVGTRFLTNLYRAIKFPLIHNVGLFSPAVMNDIAGGGGPMVEAYMRAFGRPLGAGNLCGSFRGKEFNGVLMSDSIYDQAVEKLLKTRGTILNTCLTQK